MFQIITLAPLIFQMENYSSLLDIIDIVLPDFFLTVCKFLCNFCGYSLITKVYEHELADACVDKENVFKGLYIWHHYERSHQRDQT